MPPDTPTAADTTPARGVPPGLVAWATQQMAIRVLREVTARLGQQGIDCVPIKGIVLSRQLYDNPADRPFSDVDLLMRPRDFRGAIRVARAAGWQLLYDSKILGNVNFIVDGVAFDTVCSLGPPGLCAVGVDQVAARAQRGVAPLGFEHLQIDSHDHALLMAVDAFKDKFGVKPWCREDLVRIAAGDGFSTERLVALAREARLETMLAIVAEWVLDGADSPAWRDVRRRLGEGALRTGYMRRFRSLMAGELTGWRGLPVRLLARAASDAPARRAMALALGAAGTCAFLARRC